MPQIPVSRPETIGARPIGGFPPEIAPGATIRARISPMASPARIRVSRPSRAGLDGPGASGKKRQGGRPRGASEGRSGGAAGKDGRTRLTLMRNRTILAVLSFLFAAISLGLSLREARIARLPLGSGGALFRQLLEAPPRRGLSLQADAVMLRACDAALAGRIARLQPEAAERAVAQRCARLAAEARAATPWSGAALHVEALSAQRLGDAALAGRLLQLAQSAAPFESWLAMRRVKLARALSGAADAPASEAADRLARQVLRADLGALLQSPAGRRFLAHNMAKDTLLREQLMALLPSRPPDEQAAFLRAVRAALDGRN